jgi:serine/threonine-protein kinase RsbW
MSVSTHISTTRKGDTVEIRAPGQSRVLSRVRSLVSNLARQIGFEEDEVDQIQVAVDEACSNVVQHAYHPGHAHEWLWQHRDPEIRLELRAESDRLVITINDHGRHFDFDAYQHVTLPERIQSMAPNGYGIAMIRALMDEVSYSSCPDTGNTLCMVKLLKKI